jgi:hypothetical protein
MQYPAMTRYQLRDQRTALTIFYIVMVAIMVLTMVVGALESSSVLVVSGMEVSTLIFLFVCGLNSFKEAFYLGLQNGVSRKQFFLQTAMAFGLLALLCAAADSLLYGVSGWISEKNAGFYRSYQLLGVFYPDYYAQVSPVQRVAQNLLLCVFANAAALTLGQTITLAYYRMNKAGKLWVSIGLPVFFMILLPIADAVLFRLAVSQWMEKVAGDLFTFLGRTPVLGMLAAFVTAAVCSGLSFMMIRRAQIKK